MNTGRLAAMSFSCAGLCTTPVTAQPIMIYTLHWRDISGNSNGILEPGESVEFVLDAQFTPPVGTQISYTPPPPPGAGTVAGLGYIWVDLVNTCGEASGVWTLSGPGFGGTTGTNWGLRNGWHIAGAPGTPQPDGTLRNIQAGQFPVPGQTASPLNPILEIWRGKWTPNSFTARTFTFTAQAAAAAGGSNTGAVFVEYGAGPGGEPLYTSVPVALTTMSQVSIIVGMGGPSPFCTCYANCDGSTSAPILNVNDFVCFQSNFAAGQSNANCDGTTIPPTLNVNDFVCFANRFAAGCP